jgi:cell division protein ZapA|tara:strand:+ start:113 stop:559 length:447 start_codon:yes stop_codon:yes gene_type:complete
MANVNIIFNGKEFLLSCEDGQEEHLQELSMHLNEKFDNLKKSLGNIGENKLLLITSITTMDEYFETKKKIDEKIKELNILTAKFKELKNLVYEYKEKKEDEIKRLDQEQVNLKNEIDQNKDEYEKLIDTTTSEIENFLKKASSDNSVQ